MATPKPLVSTPPIICCESIVKSYGRTTPNHSLLALRLVKSSGINNWARKKLFRFEAMWLRDLGCDEVVQEAWQYGISKIGGSMFSNGINSCRESLQVWNKMEYGHVGRKITGLEKRLQWLERQSGSISYEVEIMETRKALNNWLDAESTTWNQRSRNLWLVGGDQNTRYFHTKALSRRQRNTIQELFDDANNWQEDVRAMEHIIIDYFSTIFQSNGPSDATTIVEVIQPKVTENMNVESECDF